MEKRQLAQSDLEVSLVGRRKEAVLATNFGKRMAGLDVTERGARNCGETVLQVKDGLPKLKDFFAVVGGSGEALPE